ncbi:MAG: hypothetical protein AAFY37_03385 [Pseudomonadota bacterium]
MFAPRLAFGLISLLLATACASSPDTPPRLERLWTAGGFANPGSVALAPTGDLLFVSNANDAGRGGDGFISVMSLEGEVRSRRHIEGLDAPKGIVFDTTGQLWASDGKTVSAFNPASGALRRAQTINAAVKLQDTIALADGTVLSSDPGTNRIYEITGNGHRTWLQDPLLDAVNGLLARETDLLVTTLEGRLLSIDPGTKSISVLAQGLGQAEGVAVLRGEALLVSERQGRLTHIGPAGGVTVLIDTADLGRTINDFIVVEKVLVVPSASANEVTAWRMR